MIQNIESVITGFKFKFRGTSNFRSQGGNHLRVDRQLTATAKKID